MQRRTHTFGSHCTLLLIACNGQVGIKSVTAGELHGKMADTDQKKKYIRPIGHKMQTVTQQLQFISIALHKRQQ
jgi:BioD-like phosphotransacetylase family protein